MMDGDECDPKERTKHESDKIKLYMNFRYITKFTLICMPKFLNQLPSKSGAPKHLLIPGKKSSKIFNPVESHPDQNRGRFRPQVHLLVETSPRFGKDS